MSTLMFYPLAALAILLSLGVMFVANAVHSAILLVGVMVSIAGLFLCLGCELLAMLQVLVYAGAIMVLFLFIVTTIDTRKDEKFASVAQFAQASGIILSLFIGLLLIVVGLKFSEHLPDTGKWLGDAKSMGNAFLQSYSLPFEAITLVLLTAMVGVVVMSRDLLYRQPAKDAPVKILTGGERA